jgi:hypothetical protein
MSAQFHRILLGLLLPLAMVPMSAQAFLFCADSAAAIQFALTASNANSQNDEVRIVAGTYLLSSTLNYVTTEPNSIDVVGGWSAGCATFTGATTTLDGQGTVEPMRLASQNGSVFVEWLSFSNGLSNNGGGGLSVSAGGELRIDHNRFLMNRATDFSGGALGASCLGEMRVRGNLFFGNSSAHKGAITLNNPASTSYVIANTIVGNGNDTAADGAGGLNISGGQNFWLSNNILWNNNANGAVDLRATTWNARFNNDIGSASGTAPDALSQGDLSVEPGFAPCSGFCFSFELSPSSPLFDHGANKPAGTALTVDLVLKPRQIGAAVDIGAFESNLLMFRNSFELLP